jgi:hypothetical protein
MIQVIKTVFFFGPLLFGLGFLTPLIAQVITTMAWTPPFGLTPLVTGLILGGGLGLLAQIRGRWI